MAIAELPTGKFESNPERLGEVVVKTLGSDKCHNLQYHAQGAQTNIFRFNWLDPDGELKIAKVDRMPDSAKAWEYAYRGCNNSRGIETLRKLRNARDHHILTLDDYFVVEDNKYHNGNLAISIHPFIKGSTLAQLVEEGKVPSYRKTTELMADMLDAAVYYAGEGFVHRDIKGTNVMVTPEFEAYVLDLCNARKLGELEEGLFPTAGGDYVFDPLLVSGLTGKPGKPKKYGQNSEVHEYGSVFYEVLTGNRLRIINPREEVLVDAASGEDLTDDQGRIDIEKSEHFLEKGLKRIPRQARKLRDPLKRALTLDETVRYNPDNAIKEFAADFMKATKVSPLSRTARAEETRSRRRFMFLGGTGVAATALGGIPLAVHYVGKQEPDNRFKVSAGCHTDLSITNNLVSLELRISGSKPYSLLYNSVTEEPVLPRFLELNQGDKLYVSPCPHKLAAPRDILGLGVTHFPGHLYFQGWPAIEFATPVKDLRGIPHEYSHRSHNAPIIEFIVPEDMKDGCYYLTVDLFAHDSTEGKFGLENVKYKHPGKVISRKRIPVVVGNPKTKLGLTRLGFNVFENKVMFSELNQDYVARIGTPIEYSFKIPGTNQTSNFEASRAYSGEFGLDEMKEDSAGNLQFWARDNTGIVTLGHIPVRTYPSKYDPDLKCWDFDIPGKKDANHSIELRRQLYRA